MSRKALPFFLIAIGVILVDQTSKLLVYSYMDINTEFNVFGSWFRIHYLLNPGMAFGLKWDYEYGKLILTLFRLVAMVGIAYYLLQLVRKEAPKGLLICMGLILGGAVGNVIDSTFYGVFLDNAPIDSPTAWFHGQVIDMLYFPMINGYYPDWLPFMGGDAFQFFSPVFNLADSSIFLGVATILLFQKKYFPTTENSTEESGNPVEETEEMENTDVDKNPVVSDKSEEELEENKPE